MKPHPARLARTQNFESKRARPLRLDRLGALGIHKPVRSKQRAHALDRGEKQSGPERRVQERDVERSRFQAARDRESVPRHDLDLPGIESFLQRAKSCDEARIALDQHRAAPAAGDEFQTQHARPREKIEPAQRGHLGAQKSEPVEERPADSIRCWPQARHVGHRDRCSLPCAADDAHATGGHRLAGLHALR